MHQQLKASYSSSLRPHTLVAECPRPPLQRKASYTSSLRPHTLAAQGLIHSQLKAAYTSSLRPHTLDIAGDLAALHEVNEPTRSSHNNIRPKLHRPQLIPDVLSASVGDSAAEAGLVAELARLVVDLLDPQRFSQAGRDRGLVRQVEVQLDLLDPQRFSQAGRDRDRGLVRQAEVQLDLLDPQRFSQAGRDRDRGLVRQAEVQLDLLDPQRFSQAGRDRGLVRQAEVQLDLLHQLAGRSQNEPPREGAAAVARIAGVLEDRRDHWEEEGCRLA